jgi:hypothetical protein
MKKTEWNLYKFELPGELLTQGAQDWPIIQTSE